MKKNNILIIALVIVIIGLSGFIIYDKALSNDKEVIVDKNNDGNLNNGNNNYKDNNKDEDIEVVVEDNDNDVEKVTGNYKDYNGKCGYENTSDFDYGNCFASYTFKENKNYVSTVPVDDTYAIFMYGVYEKRLFILNDGKLYYNIVTCSDNDDSCNYVKYDFYDYDNPNNYKKLKLFNELSNIRRIKGFNSGSGVDYSLLIITNDGDVYELEYYEKFTLTKVSELEKYDVDNVIDYSSGREFGRSYKVILKDGTTLTKSIKIND